MKIVTKDILPFQENDYFTPLRSKTDYAKLVMLSARNLLLEYDLAGAMSTSKMKLIVDKMSRLFFYKEDKYFSVSFPFSIQMSGDQITEIASYSGRKVDFRSISSVISILDSEHFKINPSPIDFYIESHRADSLGLSLLEEIFQFEPSYIRYDKDLENEKGKFHPLHHVDINYSTSGTYKLGLDNAITTDYIENLINVNTECSYIRD